MNKSKFEKIFRELGKLSVTGYCELFRVGLYNGETFLLSVLENYEIREGFLEGPTYDMDGERGYCWIKISEIVSVEALRV